MEMRVVRINKKTAEQDVAIYDNELSMTDNLVSDVILCSKQASLLLNKEWRDRIAKTVIKGKHFLMAESHNYHHCIRLPRI